MSNIEIADETFIPLILPDKYEPADWQQQDIDFLTNREYSSNWSEMGCVSGESSIRVLTASGKVADWKISDAYLGFNKLNRDSRKNWKSPDPYKTLAFVDGRVRHLEIEAITYSGMKKCIKLTLEDGRSITLTSDHEVLLYPETWIEAGQLKIGQEIRVVGRKGAKHDSKRTRYVKVDNKRRHRIVAKTETGLHTHHIDETSENDSPENLRTLTLEDHSRLHAPDQIASYDAPPMKIVKIDSIGGEIETYDLSMAAPYHNFCSNGIVVHNCRKTTTGLWVADNKVKSITGNITPIILIVTTRSGKGTYFDAIPKCMDGYRVFDIDSTGADELEFLDGDILRFGMKPVQFWDKTKSENLTTPAIMLAHYHVFLNKCKMLPFLKKLEYAMIIVDEAHRIKEKDNQWTRNLKTLNCYTGYKHIMTGTGFINRPQELWSLLNFLDPKLFSSYSAFRKTFCDEFTNPATGYTFIRGVKPERLEQFRSMRKNLGPRRLLRETNPEIDLPVFTPLHVELNNIQRKMYNEIKTQLHAMDQAGGELYVVNILSMLSRLRQVCVATPEVIADYYDEKEDRRIQEIKLVEPSSKLDAFMELLESLEWDDEAKNQVVVFSCFKDPLELLQKRLENKDIPYLWMKESHNDVERYEMWHDTWPKKEHRVFMSTLQLGSESINLSSAKYCVFLDRSWSPKDNNQGVSRIYRPGQTETAQIIHINALKTTDQRVEKVNMIKQGWFGEVFGEGEEPFQTIEDQFAELLLGDDDKLLDSILNPKEPEESENDRLRKKYWKWGTCWRLPNDELKPVIPSYEDLLKEETAKDLIPDSEVAEAQQLLNQLEPKQDKNKIEIVEENGIRKLVL